jgi:hypothetical protein
MVRIRIETIRSGDGFNTTWWKNESSLANMAIGPRGPAYNFGQGWFNLHSGDQHQGPQTNQSYASRYSRSLPRSRLRISEPGKT